MASPTSIYDFLYPLPRITTLQKILLGILIPLGICLIYLLWRLHAARYLKRLYSPTDIEAARSKALLDEGSRPPRADAHSTSLDTISRLGWKDFFSGRTYSTASEFGSMDTWRGRRATETASTRAILRHGLSNPSTRSLVTGYDGGEEFEMHTPINAPLPPTFQRPHLASSLGTQAPPAALFAQKSQASLASRSRAGSDPFLEGPSSSSPLDPRPARIRALSGGKSSQIPLPRLPRPVAARGSPLKTTVRPESVGEPLPSMPAQFSSPAAASPNAGWRVFPSVEVDPEEDPETSTKVKDKGKAVD